jgi:hypothetical protein
MTILSVYFFAYFHPFLIEFLDSFCLLNPFLQNEKLRFHFRPNFWTFKDLPYQTGESLLDHWPHVFVIFFLQYEINFVWNINVNRVGLNWSGNRTRQNIALLLLIIIRNSLYSCKLRGSIFLSQECISQTNFLLLIFLKKSATIY